MKVIETYRKWYKVLKRMKELITVYNVTTFFVAYDPEYQCWFIHYQK